MADFMMRGPGLLLLIFLGACSSNVPLEIRTPVAPSPEVDVVVRDFDRFRDQRVRWGGEVVALENRESEPWIEVAARELWDDGKPRDSDHARGRFLIRHDGFLDPTVYKADRKVTVVGRLDSRLTRKIGKHPYTYPLLHSESLYLWPRDSARYYDPYWPYGYPYYPYRFGIGYGHYPYYQFGYGYDPYWY